MTASAGDIGRYKQFRRGIEQLDQEGVVQVLRSDLRGDQNPVLAAVGPMQFEVVEDRMTNEFNAPIRFSRLDYSVARRTDAVGAEALTGIRGVEVLARSDGTHLALFVDEWRRQDHHPRPPRRPPRGAAGRRKLIGRASRKAATPARRARALGGRCHRSAPLVASGSASGARMP